jgi:ring-1,2-phenylacetyl-CoA epoxidase subunit PaaB
MALQNARDIYTRRNEGRSIWVVKSSDMACTTLDEESEFFDTNGDKIYRHATFYVIPEGVKNI